MGEALPQYLKNLEKLSGLKKYDRIEEILEEERVYVRYLEDSQTAGSEVVPRSVLLSILVLGATLETALHDAIEITHDGPRTTIHDYGMSTLLRDCLLERGLCINDIGYMRSSMSLPALLYASTISRQEVIPKEAHSVCSEDACTARSIDENTYQTAHVCGAPQSCKILKSPLAQVKKVLEDGDISVVKISRAGRKYELTVCSNKKVKYIVISPIWAD